MVSIHIKKLKNFKTLNIHETDKMDIISLLEKDSDGKWILVQEFKVGS